MMAHAEQPEEPISATPSSNGEALAVELSPKSYNYVPYTPSTPPLVATTTDGAWEATHPTGPPRVDELGDAARALHRAEAAVAKGLAKCGDWLAARDDFAEAGALFAVHGHAEAAARAFLHASVITRAFKNEEETITALSLAAENLQVVDPLLTVNVLHTLAEAFVAAGLTLQAARCKRDTALILDQHLEEPEKAIQQYREAIQLYGSRPLTKSFSRNCMERITALTVKLGKYAEASQLFIEEAAMVPRNLPRTTQYLYSLLCLLADGFGSDDRYFEALYVTRKRFDVLQEEDRNMQQGKEHKLMRQLIEANDHGSLNEFDVAVFSYKSCASFKPDAVFDVLVERCRANLYEHMEQYM
ncbi:uncharacterized protein TM35_000391920 [Trypanosoma theileri]|uniref:Uncharacterized protein n=1 Tax=Trypanosoma theileri TaxID=67003 RepID=A0A1X0NKH0_9TRYP|nr:uncharacterized protein TM35_000391920 [Trypanosoma theileri]ORC85018.1 hypothetical protein TM35_000391920 [Trypanosoma theileri]